MWRGSNDRLWAPIVTKVYNLRITDERRRSHGVQQVNYISRYIQICPSKYVTCVLNHCIVVCIIFNMIFISQVAMATGQVLFQRFYYTKSFVRHPMEITAIACSCLASKVEESPRRIRDVINVYHHIRQVLNQK